MEELELLQKIDENIWYCNHLLKKFPMVFNIRMVVVRLASGGLWLHSPVPIGDKLFKQINCFGKVEHIVAPNCFHHLFAYEAKGLYQDSVLWAAPGLSEKKKEIKFDAVLNEQQPVWGDCLEFEHVGGMKKMNEVVFLHKPSKTLICSDFVFNITEESNFLMKMLWRLAGTYKKFGQSRTWRFLVSNSFDEVYSVNKILKWDFLRIVMAHGEIKECTNMELFEALSKGKTNFYSES
jgi:hypothetical protein